METLLRQKVGKSKHNFLITKHFCREKRAKKQEKRFDGLGANGLGFNGFHFPAVRAAWQLASIRANLGLVLNRLK